MNDDAIKNMLMKSSYLYIYLTRKLPFDFRGCALETEFKKQENFSVYASH